MFFYLKMSVLGAALFMVLSLSACGTADRPVLVVPAEETASEETAGRGSASDDSETEDDTGRNTAAEAAAEETSVTVHICGAVSAPGVYVLPAGSRVLAAVEAAGGLTAEADERLINEARLLTDGEQIVVPAAGEALPDFSGTAGPKPGTAADGRIDINSAGEALLETLPGIGAVKAAEIVADREVNGPFASTEDIRRVDGIGESLYERIKDKITTGQ